MRLSACVAIWLALSGMPCASQAQWSLGLESSIAHYGGSARDTSGNPRARPGDATTIGLRFGWQLGKVRASIRLSYSKPGLSITGQGLTVTDKSAGQLIEGAAAVGFRVGGIGPSGAARVELGPALHLWKFDDEIRSRVGARSAFAYEWSVTRRWTGAISFEVAASRSWFDAADLPPEFERQVTWRYGVGLGLSYRL